MKKEFCLHYAVRIFKWILSFLSSTMVAEMEQNVIKIYLYSIKNIFIRWNIFLLTKRIFIWKNNSSAIRPKLTMWFSRKKVLFFLSNEDFFFRIKIFFIEWKFNKPRFFLANYTFQRMKLYFVEEKCISSNKNILIKSCSISATLCIGQFFPSLSSLDILGLIEFF